MDSNDDPLSQTDSTANSTSSLLPHTPLALYFQPLTCCNPELPANEVEYFKNQRDVDNFKTIKPSKIRFLIMHPFQCSTKYDQMKTLTPEGKIRPSHLPNYEDLYGLHPALKILILWEMEKMKHHMSYHVLPSLYQSLFDPIPVISFDGPIYTVGTETSRICMGTYTDAVHMMKVMSRGTMLRVRVVKNMAQPPVNGKDCRGARSFNEVVITPVDVSSCRFILPVEHGAKIVMWNARSIARPSFETNFKELCNQHDPLLVVVTEARTTRKNVADVVKKIPLVYKCAVFGDGGGLYGGVVMFYKEDDCTLRQVTCSVQNCVASVELEGLYRHTPRKRVLEITEISSDDSDESDGSQEI